jgi:hypothetical protein
MQIAKRVYSLAQEQNDAGLILGELSAKSTPLRGTIYRFLALSGLNTSWAPSVAAILVLFALRLSAA